MAPRRFSRYMFSEGYIDPGTGAFLLTDADPVTYVDRADNRPHTVVEGETLDHLAEQFFPSYERGAGLYWVIANFQPEPPDGIGRIMDPTLALPAGARLIIPSEQFLEDVVFNEARRALVSEG